MIYATAILLVVAGVAAFYLLRVNNQLQQQVVVSQTGVFYVPKSCKHLGILGSTPHPTLYVKKQKQLDLQAIKLQDFLDITALKDSFTKTVQLCEKQGIDHLLIAYLPVYYAKLKNEFGERASSMVSIFLRSISPQIRELIQDVLISMDSALPVTLMLPTYNELKRIPDEVVSEEQYAQFLIKQFPALDWSDSDLQYITIINTKLDEGEQNNAIERYLQYEYLYNKPVQFMQAAIEKPRFHTYIE